MYSVQERAQVKMKGKYYKSHHKKWQHDNVKKLQPNGLQDNHCSNTGRRQHSRHKRSFRVGYN